MCFFGYTICWCLSVYKQVLCLFAHIITIHTNSVEVPDRWRGERGRCERGERREERGELTEGFSGSAVMKLETASILCAVKSTSLEQGYVSGRESWFPDMLMDMPQHFGNTHVDVREYVTKHIQKSLENMNQARRMLQGGEGGCADKRAN